MEKFDHNQYRKGLADDLRDLRTQENGKEKANIFLDIAQDTERYNFAKEEHKKEFSDSKNKQKIESEKEKLNHLGLPESWSHDVSLQGLEYLKNELKKYSNFDSAKEVPKSVIKHIFEITTKQYKKYRNQGTGASVFDYVRADSSCELQHLKMDHNQKLEFFKKAWPEGLKILEVGGSPGNIKWEKILDYELWAMGNHGQTLYTLQRRGGLSPGEIVKIIFGTNESMGNAKTSEEAKKLNTKFMQWLKDNDMLTK